MSNTPTEVRLIKAINHYIESKGVEPKALLLDSFTAEYLKYEMSEINKYAIVSVVLDNRQTEGSESYRGIPIIRVKDCVFL